MLLAFMFLFFLLHFKCCLNETNNFEFLLLRAFNFAVFCVDPDVNSEKNSFFNGEVLEPIP
jgi:hypothetical protein